MTPSEQRDLFSVDAYARFMADRLEAGQYLRSITTPSDRIFIGQGLAVGAITEAYLRDYFYAPPKDSMFADIRAMCLSPDCMGLFDYFLMGADAFEQHPEWRPAGFAVDKMFPTVAILRKHENRLSPAS